MRRCVWLVCALCWVVAVQAEAPREILLIAGEPSHAAGEHEFPDDFELLADCLNAAGLPIRATMVRGWPAPEQLASADCLFLFSDGLQQHVARGRVADLEAHVAAGRGLGVMHFALEPSDEAMAALFDEVLGGYFVVGHSVNPIWTLEQPILAEHPVARGVAMGPVKDEWYYHLRFVREIEPVLQAHPALETLGEDGPRSGNPLVRQALRDGVPQTLAWTRTTPDGVRAFGFTGGHYRFNWSDDGYRTLVLNAMVWTAGVEVPPDGVASRITPITRYGSIDEAIARGDRPDVRRHIGADPESVDRGRNPNLTPLQQAIMRRQTEIATVLIEAGADADRPDGSQRTPLHLAVDRDLPEVVRALAVAGADADRLDGTGWTPLHHAAARNKPALIEALLEGGADPMTLSERGGTPLHEAAATGGPEIVQRLLAAGVDPTVVSLTGVTALDLAIEFENEAVRTLLEEVTGAERAE
jgi:type 1 glutamine amidotransferase